MDFQWEKRYEYIKEENKKMEARKRLQSTREKVDNLSSLGKVEQTTKALNEAANLKADMPRANSAPEPGPKLPGGNNANMRKHNYL